MDLLSCQEKLREAEPGPFHPPSHSLLLLSQKSARSAGLVSLGGPGEPEILKGTASGLQRQDLSLSRPLHVLGPSCMGMNMNTLWAHTYQTGLGGLHRRRTRGCESEGARAEVEKMTDHQAQAAAAQSAPAGSCIHVSQLLQLTQPLNPRARTSGITVSPVPPWKCNRRGALRHQLGRGESSRLPILVSLPEACNSLSSLREGCCSSQCTPGALQQAGTLRPHHTLTEAASTEKVSLTLCRSGPRVPLKGGSLERMSPCHQQGSN